MNSLAMETESTLTEDIRLHRDSGTSTVLVRTADRGNRHQLTKWLANQEAYDLAEANIQTGEFDCCFLDWATLLDNQDAVRTRKQAERIPLPFVLLVPEQRADAITRALQDDAHNLHSLVDELLRIPVSGLELEQRLESVLRTRHQAIILNEEHEQLHAIRDKHHAHGVFVTDTDGIIEYVNRGFEQQSGYSGKEVLGKTPDVLNSGEHDESFLHTSGELTSGEKWHGEVVNERKDGRQYVVDQIIVPVTGADGKIEQYVAVNHEITELRELANSLNDQREQLELLNRVLRHDIRNDMQVILMWVAALESHVDSDGQDIIDRVLNSGQHVVELTDTAKSIVEAIFNGEDISLEPVDLRTLLRTVIETRAETFDQAAIRMEGKPPAVTVEANEMLSAIFRNLINNAVQHNDADEPRVTISSQVDDDSVRIRVADNGPGIPEDKRGQIFDSDERGLDSQGTGMGLYLVTNLVDMYDGSVWIEHNEPRGTVFVVELPTADTSGGDTIE